MYCTHNGAKAIISGLPPPGERGSGTVAYVLIRCMMMRWYVNGPADVLQYYWFHSVNIRPSWHILEKTGNHKNI